MSFVLNPITTQCLALVCEVDQAIEIDWIKREEAIAPPIVEDPAHPTPRQPKLNFFRRQLRKIDNGPLAICGVELPPDVAPHEGHDACCRLQLKRGLLSYSLKHF